MVTFLLKSLRFLILFARNSFGCLNHPYVTYRSLSLEKTKQGQTVYIFILTLAYFAFASLLRTGLRNPYLLTFKFNSLVMGGLIGFLGTIFLFYILGKIFFGKKKLKTLFILWSYSLLPTIIWFFVTSLMYLILPPPRTLSIWGKMYSLVFVAFSLAVLLWKIILYYLTLRFGLRLDLFKIIIVSAFFTLFLFGYSLLMYKYGIFRIPFI